MEEDNPRFVVDTHALWWYLRPERLSIAAAAVFRLAETGNAIIVVPAVVAEFYFLSAKLGQPLVPADLLDTLSSSAASSDLGGRSLKTSTDFLRFPRCTISSSLPNLSCWTRRWCPGTRRLRHPPG